MSLVGGDPSRAPFFSDPLDLVSTDEGPCTACGKAEGSGGSCSPPDLLRLIESAFDEVKSAPAKAPAKDAALPEGSTPAARLIRAAAAVTDCRDEVCVIKAAAKKNGDTALVRRVLQQNFKVAGPRDTKRLTSNYDLDGTLTRWALEFPDFFPYPFAMIDFDQENAPLARWAPADILAGKQTGGRQIRTAACILNTDVSSGRGKHWVCVFVDGRPSGKPGHPRTVEYFNSAGNPPAPSVKRWMQAAREGMVRAAAAAGAPHEVEAHTVTSVKHQRSDTECGLYALFYIRARLEGRPHVAFAADRIADEAMTRFRRHVFRA